MHAHFCCFTVNLLHSPWLSVNWRNEYSKHILKKLAENSSYWNILAIGGCNPEFNFSHFALLHLWLEWIMIISWLWFGPCLWGHHLSELNRRVQPTGSAVLTTCLWDGINTSCTRFCLSSTCPAVIEAHLANDARICFYSDPWLQKCFTIHL